MGGPLRCKPHLCGPPRGETPLRDEPLRGGPLRGDGPHIHYLAGCFRSGMRRSDLRLGRSGSPAGRPATWRPWKSTATLRGWHRPSNYSRPDGARLGGLHSVNLRTLRRDQGKGRSRGRRGAPLGVIGPSLDTFWTIWLRWP